MLFFTGITVAVVWCTVANCASSSSAKCPNEYKPFQDHCYKFHNKLVSHEDAEKSCTVEKAHLASVHSEVERVYLNEISGRQIIWIALVDKGENGTWSWTDDTAFDWHNFPQANPNNKKGNAFCVYADSTGLWYEEQCDKNGRFVCKQPLRRNIEKSSHRIKAKNNESESKCPPSWKAFEKQCYKVVLDANEITQEQAEEACVAVNAHLASIHSEMEQSFITDMSGTSGTYWIGLVDKEKNKRWTWTDGLLYDYRHWKTGQPDNADSNEFCVNMAKRTQFEALNCQAESMGYMCKKPGYNSTNGDSICPSPWKTFEKHCYRLDANEVNQSQAEANCVAQNAHLVSIHSEAEFAFVSDYGRTGAYFWTGLVKDTDPAWTWTDQTPFDYDIEWDNIGLPKNENISCGGALALDGWLDVPCDRTLDGYICKQAQPMQKKTVADKNDSGNKCPPLWKAFQNSCYKYDINGLTQEEAEAACVSEGAHLVSLHSEAEIVFVRDKVVTSLHSNALWMGLQDKGTWTWTDGSPFDFKAWDYNEPEKDYCAALHSSGKWVSFACKFQRGYVCKQKARTISGNNEVVIVDPDCPQYWRAFDSNCYKFDANPVTQAQAEDECGLQSGHLASIHSKAEGTFIIDTFGRKGTAWIGLVEKVKNRKWSWNDGSPYDYTEWSDGEPDDEDSKSVFCTHIFDDGTWNDVPCDETRGFVCKQPSKNASALSTKALKSASNTTEQGCRKFWKTFDNHCYKLDANEVTQDQAEAACAAEKARLLSIHSEAERVFVADKLAASLRLRGSSVWIGLMDPEKTRKWTWTDGTKFDFSRWDRGQTNTATIRPKANNTVTDTKSCPPFWTAFDKRCQVQGKGARSRAAGSYRADDAQFALLFLGLFVWHYLER